MALKALHITTLCSLFTLAFHPSVKAITLRENGVITGDPNTLTQDRFEANTPGSTPNPDFQYSAYDFSGVGWYTSDSVRSVTLLSDRHFITANHIGTTTSVDFLTNSGVMSFGVDSFTRIPNTFSFSGLDTSSDLTIGTLSSAIDLDGLGLQSYSLLDPSVDPRNLNTLLYGDGCGLGEGSIDGLIADNTISAGGAKSIASFSEYNIASGTNPNEAFFTGGDSGGPTFVISNTGELLLTGVHWAVGSDDTTTFSLDSYVPLYANEIITTVPGISLSFDSVPEPSSLLFIACGSLLLLNTRRKHS